MTQSKRAVEGALGGAGSVFGLAPYGLLRATQKAKLPESMFGSSLGLKSFMKKSGDDYGLTPKNITELMEATKGVRSGKVFGEIADLEKKNQYLIWLSC